MRRVLPASLIAACALAVPAAAIAAPAPIVTTKADPRILGPVVPESFWGYSMEIDQLKPSFGDGDARGPNVALAGFLKEAAAAGNGPADLRLGGGTQDEAWYNPAGAPRPPGLRANMDLPMLFGLKRFLDAADTRALVGLNLLWGDPQVPVAQAQALEELVGRDRLLGFELGNEPDFYPFRPFGNDESRRARPMDYGPATHQREFSAVRRAMRGAGIRTPVAGPGILPVETWVRGFGAFARAQGSDLAMATSHDYPFSACKGPGARNITDPTVLLEDGVVESAARRTIEFVRQLRGTGAKYRLTESNSVSCGGQAGVSNTFVAPLWGLDWAFSHLISGAEAVHFHNSEAIYRAFTAGFFEGAWRLSPSALLYAHHVFSEAAPAGARMLPATYFGQRVRQDSNVKTWGTLSRDRRTVRVLVIYKAGTKVGKARVTVPGAAGAGTVKRLTAPSPLATTSNISWAGRQVPVLSTDGRLKGDEEVSRARRGRGDAFTINMRPYTAALLTVPLRRAAPRR